MKYFPPVRGLRLSIYFFHPRPCAGKQGFPFSSAWLQKSTPAPYRQGRLCRRRRRFTLDDLAGACYPANKRKKRGSVRSAPSSSLLALLSLLPFFDLPAPVVALPAFFFRAAAHSQNLTMPTATGQAPVFPAVRQIPQKSDKPIIHTQHPSTTPLHALYALLGIPGRLSPGKRRTRQIRASVAAINHTKRDRL